MSTFGSITTISSSPIMPTSISTRTMTSPPLLSISSPVPLTYIPPLPRSATFIPPRAKPITVQPSPELSSRLGPAGELLDVPSSPVSLENLVATDPASSTSSSSFTLTYHHSSSSSSDSASEARLSFDRESEFDFSLPTSSSLVSLFSSSVASPTATSEMTTTTTRTSLEGLSIGSESVNGSGSRFGAVEYKKSNTGSGFGSRLGLNLSSRERAERRRDTEGRGSETERMTPQRNYEGTTTTSTMSVENVLELMNNEEEGRTERHAGIYGFSEEDSMLPLSSGEKEKCILC
jgi:hypothetical protein